MILNELKPSDRAASMNGISFKVKNSPLTSRAVPGQLNNPMIKIIFIIPEPKTATMIRRRKNRGIICKISVTLINISSTFPPKYPEIAPTLIPTSPDTRAAINPTVKLTLVP